MSGDSLDFHRSIHERGLSDLELARRDFVRHKRFCVVFFLAGAAAITAGHYKKDAALQIASGMVLGTSTIGAGIAAHDNRRRIAELEPKQP